MLWVIVEIIWNGPFHIGPLTRPVSVGDVLIKILETLWRAVIAILTLAGSITGAIAFWALVLEPVLFPPLTKRIEATAEYGVDPPPPMLSTTPMTSSKSEAAKIQAEMEAQTAYHNYHCSPDYPILVEFHNTSKKTVKNITFKINAFVPGHSKSVSGFNYLTTDVIILPDRASKSCWNIPLEGGVRFESLVYAVNIVSAVAD